VGLLPLIGLKGGDIERIRLLRDGSELRAAGTDFRTAHYGGVVFVHISDNPVLPDEVDTVIEVTLRKNSDIINK
jgi:alpha-L-fucosidase